MMDVINGLVLVLLRINFLWAFDYIYEKSVSQLEWGGRCSVNKLALNDCNWCRCNSNHRYTCDARACSGVDMFGHFSDAIQDINVVMEGKGSWRTAATACEPGVQYRRAGLLCVCTDDGTWPNPVCRDMFRVLHEVVQTRDTQVTGQDCSPTNLYLVSCNVCFCPLTGQLDPSLCTKKECTNEEPVVKADSEDYKQQDTVDEEIYAECNPARKYKIGCKSCKCLKNNRLQCDNCTSSKKESAKSFCSHFEPGQIFSRDCNLCYCSKRGFAFCTAKKCLPQQRSSISQDLTTPAIASTEPFDEENCIPGRSYKVDCNTCICDIKDGKKFFGCTLKYCSTRSDSVKDIHTDCVKGTFYELNCLLCQCTEVQGVKTQLCTVNPECTNKDAARQVRTWNLDFLHGYCEPLHSYKQGCNSCHCLTDGKTLRCTSHVCDTPAPISAEIVPLAQSGTCPRGLTYRIQCNYCFCLSNGNALCTTHDCSEWKSKINL